MEPKPQELVEERLMRRALRERWNLPDDIRDAALARLKDTVKKGTTRDANVAIGILARIDFDQKHLEANERNVASGQTTVNVVFAPADPLAPPTEDNRLIQEERFLSDWTSRREDASARDAAPAVRPEDEERLLFLGLARPGAG